MASHRIQLQLCSNARTARYATVILQRFLIQACKVQLDILRLSADFTESSTLRPSWHLTPREPQDISDAQVLAKPISVSQLSALIPKARNYFDLECVWTCLDVY